MVSPDTVFAYQPATSKATSHPKLCANCSFGYAVWRHDTGTAHRCVASTAALMQPRQLRSPHACTRPDAALFANTSMVAGWGAMRGPCASARVVCLAKGASGRYLPTQYRARPKKERSFSEVQEGCCTACVFLPPLPTRAHAPDCARDFL